METKGIETDLEDRKLQWKGFEALSFLRALKIAVGFRKIYRKLFFSSVQMDFYRALRQIHEQNICPLFSVLMEPELKYEENPKNHSPKPGSIKNTYDTFLAEIPADATEHLAQQLIKDAVKKIVPKQKAYYDYIKKKLEVAEKIQLIPCEILMSREGKVVEGIQHRLHLELATRRGPVPCLCAVPWRHRTNEAGQEEEIGVLLA
ncbi:uncharacterized protein [Miscanthus floridulus]|uniref:uncharacterized protein isoform X3 n=1 Tax=Miscanthus floridulus TaxID=154761 RepID=UPI003458599F